MFRVLEGEIQKYSYILIYLHFHLNSYLKTNCKISLRDIDFVRSRGRKPAGKKGEDKAPHTHQVMSSSP